MSQHDLVSAQISNVWITHHPALNVTHSICQTICGITSTNFLGNWFSVSRKGGTGGGGLVYTPKG